MRKRSQPLMISRRFRRRRSGSNARRQSARVHIYGRLRTTVLRLRYANGQTVLSDVVQGQRRVLPLRPVVETPQTQLQHGRDYSRREYYYTLTRHRVYKTTTNK